MSYRIDPDRPIPKNLRRLARRQLDNALAALAEPGVLGLEATVHDVRKRCKKIRGLIRLVRPGLGREYRRANAHWHALGRERPVGEISDLTREPADRPPVARELLVDGALR